MLPASFNFATARREHVLHPFGLAAVGERDDESIRRSKDVHSGSVGLPRLAASVRENAETRKSTREQARDPIGEGNVDLRQSSLAEPHHKNAGDCDSNDYDGCGSHWSIVPPHDDWLDSHRGEIRLDFDLCLDLARTFTALDPSTSDSSELPEASQ
jgi:hypothetical protein